MVLGVGGSEDTSINGKVGHRRERERERESENEWGGGVLGRERRGVKCRERRGA